MRWSCAVLTTADVILTVFVVFPLSILHWRGTWQLQEVYFSPTDLKTSVWISFMLGANGCIIELLVQPWLNKKLSTSGRCLYLVVSRLHLYIHGWAVLFYWRGVWDLLEIYWSSGWGSAVILYLVCQLIMILAKTVRTAVGIPVSLRLDTSSDLLESDLVFKTHPREIIHFVLDCLFTQFIVITSTICIWRSIWSILDTFIFPHRHYHSDVASLVVGLTATIIFHVLSVPLSLASSFLSKNYVIKLVFEDFVFIVLTWTNLLLWRGAWNLCIHHFLPPDGAYGESIGAWVSHIIGTVGLMVLQLFNNVGLHNVERDGIYEGGEGMDNIKFLRQLLPACNNITTFCYVDPRTMKGKSTNDWVEEAEIHCGALLSEEEDLLLDSGKNEEPVSSFVGVETEHRFLNHKSLIPMGQIDNSSCISGDGKALLSSSI